MLKIIPFYPRPQNIADEYDIIWPWRSGPMSFFINDTWKLFKEPLMILYQICKS